MEQLAQVQVWGDPANVTVPGQDAQGGTRQFLVISVVFGLSVMPAALFSEWQMRRSVSPSLDPQAAFLHNLSRQLHHLFMKRRVAVTQAQGEN